ncbi:MAG: hypothetical protein ACLQF1_05965 [Methyloceanibacter sp.]
MMFSLMRAAWSFRLTYAGRLPAHRDDQRLPERSLRVHEIRKEFHKQLAELWRVHPALVGIVEHDKKHGSSIEIFNHDGFKWLPIVTEAHFLVCHLEILILRAGAPGRTLYDLDNRLKTIFDALRMAKSPSELGSGTNEGLRTPDAREDPFYVLLQDDSLITHVGVTTDTLLEPVPEVPPDDAARLVIDVTVRPSYVGILNAHFL